MGANFSSCMYGGIRMFDKRERCEFEKGAGREIKLGSLIKTNKEATKNLRTACMLQGLGSFPGA
jgi:hypothetical protein